MERSTPPSSSSSSSSFDAILKSLRTNYSSMLPSYFATNSTISTSDVSSSSSSSSSPSSSSSTVQVGRSCSTDTDRVNSTSFSSSKSKSHNMIDLLSCGFVSGVLQAVLFNPWDRALYLSIKVINRDKP